MTAELASAYIPTDRRQALVKGIPLPNRTKGSALFADISGFTPLTEALVKELGPRRGADELTRQLNRVYDALVNEVHRYQGSVITFSGDAITCWFDSDPGQRAVACALAMQQAMQEFSAIETPAGGLVSLAMKAAVTTGPVRRFLIGAPHIQRLDVLAGTTLDVMAEAEHQAEKGEVVIGPQTAENLKDQIEINAWRVSAESGTRFAVISALHTSVAPTPWPEQVDSELSMETIRPWLLPPVYERIKSGQGRYLAELRPAVALFLRFGGLDYDQDDAASEKLDAYIRWVQTILARYDSYLFQLTIGDKGCYLYAAFGAPVTHGDDEARAVAAALELRTPPPEMDYIAGIQIGISKGRMRAGAYGGTKRLTYGVLGDEVNLAARLMGQAQAGQVLVSQPIVTATANSYNFESLGLIKVKGKEEALPVYLASGRHMPSSQRPGTLYPNPLVGREQELAQMEAVLDLTLTGKGQILRVEGEAGLGKSHLVAEFAEQAFERNFIVSVGACQSTSQDIAYYPWRQIARAVFNLEEQPLAQDEMAAWSAEQIARITQLVREANPSWELRLPLLGDLLDLPIPDNPTTAMFDPQLRQDALFGLAVEIVHSRASRDPLLLLLEDVHWMDEVSRELTVALSRVIANIPVLIVLVHRPPLEAGKPYLPELNNLSNHHYLNLSELTEKGVAGLVTYRLGGIPSPLAVSLIQAKGQGNPFFTEELVDALRETGNIYRRFDGQWLLRDEIFEALREANALEQIDGQWRLIENAPLSAIDLGVPESIHGIVLSRLDRLPEAYKLTLKVASVIGRIFEFDLLHQAYPLQLARERLLEQIKELVNSDFARLEMPPPHMAHMFKHNVTQEVTYNTLLEDQQKELHRSVGATLEKLNPEAVEQLAYHYSRSGLKDKTLFYLDKAASKAQHEYANETALAYYQQALALEERWTWRKAQAEILHILGRRDEEEKALTLLAQNSEAPPFEAPYLWGQYYEATGNYEQAQRFIEQAVTICRRQKDAVGEVRALGQLGLIARRQGNYEQAKERYNHALNLLRRENSNVDENGRAITQILNDLGIVLRQQGKFEEAKTHYEQALILSRQSQNRQREAEALNSLGVTAFYERNFAEALNYHRQALEIRHNIGDRAGEGTSLFNLAVTIRDSGDYGQAQEYLSSALAIQQATGNRWEEVNVWNDMGMLYQELGDLVMARTCLQQALNLSREIGDEVGQAYILGNLGLVLRDQQDFEAAHNLLTEGLTIAETQADQYVVSMFVSELALVDLQAENYPQAIEKATRALQTRRELKLNLAATADLATLASAHLALHNEQTALDYAQQAKTILDDCGGEGPINPQQDYYLCAKVFMACGQQKQAREALKAAYDLVMARANKITDPEMRRTFLEQVYINQEIISLWAVEKQSQM